MPRPALLAPFAVLLVACRPAADAEQVDSPGGSVAGTETSRATGATKARLPSASSKLATSLVGVATVNASEAQPCERICGSLGDCLFVDETVTDPAASGLELECLDICVYTPDGEQAKAEFLACGAKTECGQLQACAERTWAKLSEAHHGPEIAGVQAGNSCKAGCRWYYSCLFAGAPPGEAYLDSQMEQSMKSCEDSCAYQDVATRGQWERMTTCLRDRCSYEHSWECMEDLHY